MGLRYNVRTTYINTSGNYDLDIKCNGWAAVNIGDCIAKVNGAQIKPPILVTLSGEATGAIGFEGEIFEGQNHVIPVMFTSAGANPLIMIIEKYYTC